MDNIDFIIDSKDNSILSKKARIFHYVFGLFLTITSLIAILKFIKQNSFDISFYSISLIFLVGILWIFQGFKGRVFMFARKYISFSNDSICLKKAFKNEIQLSPESMVLITIKPSKLIIKTKDNTVDYDLTWINFNELQQLKKRLSEFGNQNKIEIKSLLSGKFGNELNIAFNSLIMCLCVCVFQKQAPCNSGNNEF